MGEVQVPADAHWGAQTQRAVENFPISGRPVEPRIIHALALLALDDCSAGVLARGQHAARRDARVLQELDRDEPVVRRRLGIVEDRPQLGEVARSQQVRDVEHRFAGEQRERLGVDPEELLPAG